ncbi:MAG: S24/S26 family peptidase, partial [Acidobacteriota bacterium]|nr:S24/S26 family peptidase [Acidobacteriota bacterium]
MSSINTTELIVDLLRRGHAVKFRVRGDSMHPTIRDNESLHVEPVTDVRIGDVVLVLADRGLTAHRVIAMDAETITTRG